MKVLEGKVAAMKQAFGDAKDKRRAFGDINNRLG